LPTLWAKGQFDIFLIIYNYLDINNKGVPMAKENWVDYKEIKAKVSIETVLKHYGPAGASVQKPTVMN